MNNIGILTFHRADNYGAVLQNFALIKVIEKNNLGIVNTIDYRSDSIEKPYIVKILPVGVHNPIKYLYNILLNLLYYNVRKQKKRVFDEFREKYLKLSTEFNESNIIEVNTMYDGFITGSDQVWNRYIVNRDFINHVDFVYTLDFVKNKPRISYGASAGNSLYVDPLTLPALGKIDYLSVREESLQKYLAYKIPQRTISVVLDPVFLMDKTEWDTTLAFKRIIEEKYIFIYCVGVKNEVIKKAKYIAKMRNLKLIYLDYRYRLFGNTKCLAVADPLEFVQLIRDAEFVVTSSFHATAFSIIFKTPFLVYVPKSNSEILANSSRIQDLLNHIGLEERVITVGDDCKERFEISDIKKSYQILKKDICSSISFLKKAMKF